MRSHKIPTVVTIDACGRFCPACSDSEKFCVFYRVDTVRYMYTVHNANILTTICIRVDLYIFQTALCSNITSIFLSYLLIVAVFLRIE